MSSHYDEPHSFFAPKARAFWFHYNKPASAQAGCPILTVHQAGVCRLVKGIKCAVPTETRLRKTQPRCVIAGKGVVTIVNRIAIIKSS